MSRDGTDADPGIRGLTELAATTNRGFHDVLRDVDVVALVDFPNHGNVGDSAIWLGEYTYLRAAGKRITHISDPPRYSPGSVRRALSSGTSPAVLIHGGGNFGDLYPKHQRFRERVAVDFPDVPIVQMPQSIYFEPTTSRLHPALSSHGDFTLLVRDERSEARAKASGMRIVKLVPDAAHLCPLPTVEPTQDVVVLARRDKETRFTGRAPGSFDWVENASGAGWQFNSRHRSVARRVPVLATPSLVTHTWVPLATGHVMRGSRLLGAGRVVVTDRLHAMLLALLMGRPVVAVDNASGKLSSYAETWCLADLASLSWASSFEEALPMARELATR